MFRVHPPVVPDKQPVRILLPFKDQTSADVLRKQLNNLSKTENRNTSTAHLYYSRIPITRTLANPNQHRFPVDFVHTFTVILPSVTRTLDNSNLPLTQTNFHFPLGHFVYNLTLNNSNHVFQDVTSKRIQYRRSKH